MNIEIGGKYEFRASDEQNNEGDLIDNSTPSTYEVSALGYMTANLDDWTPSVSVILSSGETRTYSRELFLKLFKEVIE